MTKKHDIFPASRAEHLDGWFRRLVLRPDRVCEQYVTPGDTVLDIGCGPGLLTRAAARMSGENGCVIAVDVQQEMLDLAKQKAEEENLTSRIRFFLAEPETLGLCEEEWINTAFAWYVVHEVPDPERLIQEVFSLLVPGGLFFIAEPGFVVSAKDFRETIHTAEKAGFSVFGTPKVRFSHAVLLKKG
ncbi:MAG: class I SAM-dependent methyltransferase [Methanospirillaceae archaeon]|nr:class I SAM-dependent methyltransferase [Methanospirillaceae archaeon]